MDERKMKILAAVVDEYIMTGEPVGSKAVSQRPGINVSAATIRNEMAMLEELGFLEQPHTSAGRVPTFNGYKLYIEKLMRTNPLSEQERRQLDMMFDSAAPTEEALVQSAAQALTELTKCAAVVSNISPQFSVITKVEVIPTGKRLYVLLLITSSGSIKNKICRLEFDLTNEQLEFFSNYMQQNLQGVQLENLSEKMIENLILAMGTYMMTLTPLVQAVYDLSKDLLGKEIVISGEKNLLSCKEFDRNEIVHFIEHKNELAKFLDESFSGIHVIFGEENQFAIGNSSMIVSKYKKGGRTAGSLGIIGPMRLDYSKIIPYVEYFSQKITDLISNNEEDFLDEDKK